MTTIIVNGKAHELCGSWIGYRGLCRLAGHNIDDYADDTLFTVTHNQNGGGTILPKTSMRIRNGTVFNVFKTG